MQSNLKISRVTSKGLHLLSCRYKHKFSLRQKHSIAAVPTLAPGYDPRAVEKDKYVHRKAREACGGKHGSYRMLLPPPNVTGILHLGHALNATLQDVICRQHRQMGYEVEWIPGTDHAGIATQVIVEKSLLKERGITRHQLGRIPFLLEVWKWKRKKGDGIIDDLRKLGCTLDWDSEYFTMDERQSRAVDMAFIRLFEEGLIQRQKSLVNWSCALESAISDIEVDLLELKGPTALAVPGHEKSIEFGRIYDIKYHLCDSDEEIVVSTTRPETLLGDVAVAVHPQDPRYEKYRNREQVFLNHPFRKEPIPLIFDVNVDQDFGTGAVKLTPAHDRADYEVAQVHLLEPIQVFTEQGKITDRFEEFKGLLRFDARQQILDALSNLQLLDVVKPHSMVLPICSRTKDVVEYMLRPQWFLHCKPLADAAMSEVRSGRLKIQPENYEIDWFRWLGACRDWCISRQLWWGHQIPAYLATDVDGNTCWVAALNEDEARKRAKTVLNAEVSSVERDPDVLDTWFSSSLLPFSVFNWPSSEYKMRYPLDLMATGHDILFFWVARMVMLGVKLTGQAPFKKVVLNGIVCDAHGRKMSKSLGNVVTPQQVIQGASLESLEADLQGSHDAGLLSTEELNKSLKGLQKMFPKGIQQCGTDALRFTLCSHNIKNHFINFDVAECYTNKLFLNKIWQATRYTLGAAEKLNLSLSEIETLENCTLGKWDRWILSRLSDTLTTVAQSIDQYDLHMATSAIKQFFYNSLCDVYLETTKPAISKGTANGYINCATLATCLSWGLQSMSVFTPFIAEELLQYLPRGIHLQISRYFDADIEAEIDVILAICQAIRQLKSQNKISRKHEPCAHIFAPDKKSAADLQLHLKEMRALTLTKQVVVEFLTPAELKERRQHFQFFSTAGHYCSFGLQVNAIYEKTRQEQSPISDLNHKKLARLQTELERYRMRINDEGFQRSASEQVQKRHNQKIQQLELEIKNIKNLGG
ncbi:PREDICTED: valine--tRNA ligase isoform X1 [Rhagoletis zephyria]|uniref:valine--tRNA ligase isoform X1 n=1 Tax=Rhagoletis zephyria TaxID=28612 RepID=UPI000811A51F|nr:PREDICTED: valine--tRNA ligase isoform X1 [Rhagoletis zephyria]